MSETRFHGARTKEETDITKVINDIDSSVIGVIVVADDADEDAFPLNTPTLITRPQSMLGKAGTTGTLYKTLKAISDQASAKVIVVRVAAAKPPEPKAYRHTARQRHSKRSTVRTHPLPATIHRTPQHARIAPISLYLMDTPTHPAARAFPRHLRVVNTPFFVHLQSPS